VARERLDQLLVARGLAETRTKAQAVILSGKVKVDGVRSDKPGRSIALDAEVEVEAPPRFVSRGGEKLVAAIKQFQIPFADCHVLDVGASTGGFTDCVLQHGAIAVTCLDVGRAQLHDRLRRDPRVTNIEQVNARLLGPGELPCSKYERIVIDVSFISLRSVLPAVWSYLASGGFLIALVKPQFEAGREEASKGRGVIRSASVRERVLREISEFVTEQLPGAKIIGSMESPLSGADGNKEFLLAVIRVSG
jgi:23S rRNA (cytidine1920-2'-O)/16S rRNA (cytidine1409-2'-O)-methyltransferase